MKEIYRSGLFTVTKDSVNNKYTFFGNRIPLLKTTPEGAIELAKSILIEEGYVSSGYWQKHIESSEEDE
jgi:hypothetical protein